MNCPECSTRMSVVKTAVFRGNTKRVVECACGIRCETEERVIRRLTPVTGNPPATGGQPPGNAPPTAPQPPGNPGGVGGALSGDRSVPDPESGPSSPDLPERAPAREPAPPTEGIWTAARWKTEFGAAWSLRFHRGARHYGSSGDGKACGALADLIRELPETDVLAAQERAGAMFAEFFADTSKAVTDARHNFAFFVGRWGGLRVPKIAAPDSPYCPWHQRGNQGRRALNPIATCPECKHLGALARPARAETGPQSLADLLPKGPPPDYAAELAKFQAEKQKGAPS